MLHSNFAMVNHSVPKGVVAWFADVYLEERFSWWVGLDISWRFCGVRLVAVKDGPYFAFAIVRVHGQTGIPCCG